MRPSPQPERGDGRRVPLRRRRGLRAAELDQATDRHPVLVKRGGHNDVVNTYALRLAGVTEDTPVPPGGTIGRDSDGKLDGRLIDTALHLVPAPDRTVRIDGLRLAGRDYAATGIGTVHDCAVTPEDYAVLLAARAAEGAQHPGAGADAGARTDQRGPTLAIRSRSSWTGRT